MQILCQPMDNKGDWIRRQSLWTKKSDLQHLDVQNIFKNGCNIIEYKFCLFKHENTMKYKFHRQVVTHLIDNLRCKFCANLWKKRRFATFRNLNMKWLLELQKAILKTLDKYCLLFFFWIYLLLSRPAYKDKRLSPLQGSHCRGREGGRKKCQEAFEVDGRRRLRGEWGGRQDGQPWGSWQRPWWGGAITWMG